MWKIVLFFIAELIVIIQVGSVIGAIFAVLILIADVAIGASLLKNSVFRFGYSLNLGNLSNPHAFFFAIAGLLFIFPGYISDLAALLLLIPKIRQVIIDQYIKSSRKYESHSYGGETYRKGVTIEGKATRTESSDK
ncbi:MAG: FxsA family protein [Succinivibrio sp.]